MNRMQARRSRVPTSQTDIPPIALCNSQLCSGTPFVLNPAPVVAPNVDTIYGGAQMDIANPAILQVPNPSALPPVANPGPRYYSINFVNAYTDIMATISNENYPHGGYFCLYITDTQKPACAGAAAQKGITLTAYIQLPRFTFALARVYSSGAPSPAGCGPDGCVMLNNIGIASIPVGQPTLDPFTVYFNLMAPTLSTACAYHYGQAPCANQNQNAFWTAVCTTMTLSPPSAQEGAYINTKFASMGLHYGCTAATLNFTALNAGFMDGYNALEEGESFVGISGHQRPNEWKYFPFNGKWGFLDADYLLRGVAASRLHFLVDNHQSAYWAAYTDSRPPKQRTRLSCADGVEYRVQFSNESGVPVNYAENGFWSVTLYDPTWYLVSSTENIYGVRSNVNTGLAPAGFIVSANCNGRSNCVNGPPGPFQLLFRGYWPEAGLDAEGDYQLPKIQECNKGCK
jgi:hypothetical protein